MEVHGDEGLATHIGPEPCTVLREAKGEASVGECTGQPLSRERILIPGADVVPDSEGNTDGRVSASIRPPGVVVEPGMCESSLDGNRDISRPTARVIVGGPHREGEEP